MNTYLGGGASVTALRISVRLGVAHLEHFWYSPAEVAEMDLEVANWGFAQACVDHHAVPPTSTHFH